MDRIHILGAGIAGTTVAQCLRLRSIPFVIYDRAKTPSFHHYGMTLLPETFQFLSKTLNTPVDTIRKEIALEAVHPTGGALRVHRGKLELLLREGLEIEWNTSVREVQPCEKGQGILISFENDEMHHNSCVTVAADSAGEYAATGPSLTKNSWPMVLPYVAVHGRRTIRPGTHERLLRDLQDSYLYREVRMPGGVLLALEVIGHDTEREPLLRYTYSRAARGKPDPLFRPTRPASEASNVPDEFYAELESLGVLEHPLSEAFDIAQIKKDRLLLWLMRTVDLDMIDSGRLAGCKVALIGDAAHAEPIIGGNGANNAIADAVNLVGAMDHTGELDLTKFYSTRLQVWKAGVQDSKIRISQLHSAQHPNL